MNYVNSMNICTSQAKDIRFIITTAIFMVILMTILAYKQYRQIKEI